MVQLQWRLAALLNEGLGSLLIAAISFALTGLCFHHAFLQYVRQSADASKLLTMPQEPFRGEPFPVLAAALTSSAKRASCTEPWHLDFAVAKVHLDEQRRTLVGDALLPDASLEPCTPDSPECTPGLAPVGWFERTTHDRDLLYKETPLPAESDFRAPASLDRAAAVDDQQRTSVLSRVARPPSLSSLYLITNNGSVRILPHGRMRGSDSHRVYSMASYFQHIANNTPPNCGDGYLSQPYLDLVGAGAISTYCEPVWSLRDPSSLDGMLCADLPLANQIDSTLLQIAIATVEIGSDDKAARVTLSMRQNVDVEAFDRDRSQLLAEISRMVDRGISGSAGGLGSLHRLGAPNDEWFAALVAQTPAKDGKPDSREIAIVKPNFQRTISLPYLFIGLVPMVFGGYVVAKTSRRRHQREYRRALRGPPYGVVIQDYRGHIEFMNACAESILCAQFDPPPEARVICWLLGVPPPRYGLINWFFELLVRSGRFAITPCNDLLQYTTQGSHSAIEQHAKKRQSWITSEYDIVIEQTQQLVRVIGAPILDARSQIGSFGILIPYPPPPQATPPLLVGAGAAPGLAATQAVVLPVPSTEAAP